MNITEQESVILEIAKDATINDCGYIGLDSVPFNPKISRGIIGSLIKKGLMDADRNHNYEKEVYDYYLTNLGRTYLNLPEDDL